MSPATTVGARERGCLFSVLTMSDELRASTWASGRSAYAYPKREGCSVLNKSRWEDRCSQTVDGLHAVSSVLPFNVFSFAVSARDSCTE